MSSVIDLSFERPYLIRGQYQNLTTFAEICGFHTKKCRFREDPWILTWKTTKITEIHQIHRKFPNFQKISILD